MRSAKIIAVAIAILALIWIGSGFLGGDRAPAPEDSAAKPAPHAEKKIVDVRIREVTAETFDDVVQVTGRAQASKKVQLKTETDGQLIALLKEEGDSVTLDEPIAELELRDRSARLREAKQRVNQRSIEYNAAQKLANKGFNSKVKLSQTLADLEDAKAELKRVEVDLSKTKIKAPFDGIIYQQDVDVGDYLAVGNSLFTVVSLNPIEFVAFVSERNIRDVKIDSPARVVFLNEQGVTGTVSYIAPAADEQTRTFRILISAPNESLEIKEGLTATVYIPAQQKKAHKISPSILSLDDDGQIGVKIVTAENKVKFVPVSILADKPDAMWIEGVPETARMITVGQDFVIEGQTVNPVLSDGEGLL